jgi:hypothetical protein
MLDQLRQVRISELRLEADIWDELTPQEQGLLRRALDLRYRSDHPPVSWDGGSSESDPSYRGLSADSPTSHSPTADSSGADSHGTDSHGTDCRAESHAAPQATEHRSTGG